MSLDNDILPYNDLKKLADNYHKPIGIVIDWYKELEGHVCRLEFIENCLKSGWNVDLQIHIFSKK